MPQRSRSPADRSVGAAGEPPFSVGERASPGILEHVARSRAFVAAGVVLPGLWPAWPLFVSGDPSVAADPAKFVLHHLGFTAAVILALTLLLTPLRVVYPRWRVAQVLQRHRRFIGVTAFVYAALHVTMHFIYEGGFETFRTDWRKPFIAVGLVAFVVLAVLAVTSAKPVVRALGGRRWKRVHRAVYLAAVLVVYHQVSARKVFPIQVVWIFGPLLAFEIARVWRTFAARRREAV